MLFLPQHTIPSSSAPLKKWPCVLGLLPGLRCISRSLKGPRSFLCGVRGTTDSGSQDLRRRNVPGWESRRPPPSPPSFLPQRKTSLAFCCWYTNMMCVGRGGDGTEQGLERTAEQSLREQSRKGQGAHRAFGHHIPTPLSSCTPRVNSYHQVCKCKLVSAGGL